MTNEARKDSQTDSWNDVDHGPMKLESWKADDNNLWGVEINGRVSHHREWDRGTAEDKAIFVHNACALIEAGSSS